MIGQVLLSRYHVQELLGRGGMAEVYKVWDKSRNTFLAIKLLNESLSRDSFFVDKFRQEASTLEKLQHPNIVRIYGLKTDNERVFILMDYVDGRSLKDEIARATRKGLSLQRILEVMNQICKALNYAHLLGSIHCDIKSKNILIDSNGSAYIADFGITQYLGTSSSEIQVGTPTHMAPEQISGNPLSHHTDMYALGVLIFEMLTGGKLPFNGNQSSIQGTVKEKIMWEHLYATPLSPKIYRPGISADLENIVFRCLEKEPQNRYDNAMDLFNDLTIAIPGELEPEWDTTDHKEIHWEKKPAARKISGWMWFGMIVAIISSSIFVSSRNSHSRSLSNNIQATQAPSTPFVTTPSNQNRGGIYDVASCMDIWLDAANYVEECVQSVEVLPDGRMRFNITWTAFIGEQYQVPKGSDKGNRNIYLTDDTGKRYDHISSGGDANNEIILRNGISVKGWFIFPIPKSEANYFIFHDDDNQKSSSPIYKDWP